MQRLTNRLSYANVTATLALFIALGGTGYAAITLPRNSVGSNQIRPGAVSSSELKNRGVRLSDLAISTRSALRGATGPAGVTGPAGAPAIRYFASVSATGALVRGNATAGGTAGSTGQYEVQFPSSVSGCSFVATVGSTDGTVQPAGRATVSDLNGKVGVQTYDASGAPSALPFHLIAAC